MGHRRGFGGGSWVPESPRGGEAEEEPPLQMEPEFEVHFQPSHVLTQLPCYNLHGTPRLSPPAMTSQVPGALSPITH